MRTITELLVGLTEDPLLFTMYVNTSFVIAPENTWVMLFALSVVVVMEAMGYA